jgi:carbonic anhydrase
MTATDDLLRNNLAYAEGSAERALPSRPAKEVAILACMDARIDVHKILGLQEGDAHVIRNAGGLPTEDAIRSLLISQRVLGTKEIILIHHTECGMLNLPERELKEQVEKDTGTSPPFSLGAVADLEENLRNSIQSVRDCTFLPQRHSVRGFIFDVASGRLHEVEESANP